MVGRAAAGGSRSPRGHHPRCDEHEVDVRGIRVRMCGLVASVCLSGAGFAAAGCVAVFGVRVLSMILRIN